MVDWDLLVKELREENHTVTVYGVQHLGGSCTATANVATAGLEVEKGDEWELSQPLPLTKAAKTFSQHLNSLLNPINEAIEAGNRVTLLKRVGNDCKLPVMSGFNDPEQNIWDVRALRGQIDWAVAKDIDVVGFGLICGSMSRNRLALDFDRGDRLAAVAAKVLTDTRYDILTLPRVRSGRTDNPGYHLHLRTSEAIKSQTLARYPKLDELDKNGRPKSGVICEIIGEGKQVVAPGSLHKSGRIYELEYGDPFDPPELSIDLVNRILAVIRTFDEIPPEPPKPRPAKTLTPYQPDLRSDLDKRALADRYNSENSIESELERHGYTPGDQPDYYRHPNGDTCDSVKLNGATAYHFGANDAYAGNGLGADRRVSTPFSLYAYFQHGGNWGEANKALAERYGVAHKPHEKIDPNDVVWKSAPADVKAEAPAPQPEPPASTPTTALSFDLNRLPKRIAQGLAGLGKANPFLPLSAQVLVPFAFAGNVIGKRRYVQNFSAFYYPNLWTIVVGASNSNKTGTRNLVQNATPIDLTLPDSATLEALIARIGRTVKNNDNAELSAARKAAIIEDGRNLEGGMIIADEVTGSLKKLLGGDGSRNTDRNMEDVLRLAGSGERIEQPRITCGYRLAADVCVSLIGFTNATTWEEHFCADRYRANGFIGRIVPCCEGLRLTGLPEATSEDWGAFVGATLQIGSKGAESWLPENQEQEKRKVDFGVSDTADPIKEAMQTVQKCEAWQCLQDTVGDYTTILWGKIIGHAFKLAMICEWYEGKAVDWFIPCAELVTCCYANYFHATYSARAGLTTQETAAIAYVRANPGATANDLRKKLGLRDNREIYQLINGLIEADRFEAKDGRQKGSVKLYLKG